MCVTPPDLLFSGLLKTSESSEGPGSVAGGVSRRRWRQPRRPERAPEGGAGSGAGFVSCGRSTVAFVGELAQTQLRLQALQPDCEEKLGTRHRAMVYLPEVKPGLHIWAVEWMG